MFAVKHLDGANMCHLKHNWGRGKGIWMGGGVLRFGKEGVAIPASKSLSISKSHIFSEKSINFKGFFSKYRSIFHNFSVTWKFLESLKKKLTYIWGYFLENGTHVYRFLVKKVTHYSGTYEVTPLPQGLNCSLHIHKSCCITSKCPFDMMYVPCQWCL